MATATALVIVKRFTYRGDPSEEWSNKYWLTGSPPGDEAAWRQLFDDLVVYEKALYRNTSSVVAGLGYSDNAPGAHAAWTVDLTALGEEVPGTALGTQERAFAGDQAAMVQWRTNRKNSRGKWIYLRKFFHDGTTDETDPDRIAPEMFVHYQTLADALWSGFAGGQYRIRSQTQEEELATSQVSPYVTTRTLKRRGKRP